jgi:hypothetical protein
MSNSSKPTPPTVAPGASPILHAAVSNPAEIERIKAEFAAKMKASAKTWPGRKGKTKRRQ